MTIASTSKVSGADASTPTLSLGFSTCPNDTFIFHALVKGLISTPFRFVERLEDVETLNRLVLAGSLDLSKVSYHLFGHVRDSYCLLRSGGALGRGCGPLLVAAGNMQLSGLRNLPIAVPGEFTTACLLLRLFDAGFSRLKFLPFHEIMPKVASGEFAAGVIIHESRFTYQESGLVKLLDLGEWWEETTGFPIPLGGIVARRSLGREVISQLDSAVAASVTHALANPGVAKEYIRSHAQEMSDEVCAAHIGVYVNDFSVDIGVDGQRAVECLMARAEAAGVIPRAGKGIFTD
ncbi:1,4-dihydroxy-6-naphtoate synthase [Geobacter sp. OR-1]|uniref:1,4-dihydroxy-6-naphthoate synthase n=1 Tax=Geobacter sp. OR-1 TaxID=1266765 RepID=UPI000542A9F7|nr:1,4-dihydroxy-6-naphthoate synthase [Geobacter sp. OR-1]GAM08771.1 1,4-dihydroxy-6-naphtoate synthase [Geobacter sp. OR-1]